MPLGVDTRRRLLFPYYIDCGPQEKFGAGSTDPPLPLVVAQDSPAEPAESLPRYPTYPIIPLLRGISICCGKCRVPCPRSPQYRSIEGRIRSTVAPASRRWNGTQNNTFTYVPPARRRCHLILLDTTLNWEKVAGTFCAKHPSGRSGKRCLPPFPLPLFSVRETRTGPGGPPDWGR